MGWIKGFVEFGIDSERERERYREFRKKREEREREGILKSDFSQSDQLHL